MLLEGIMAGTTLSVYLPGSEIEYKSKLIMVSDTRNAVILVPVARLINLNVRVDTKIHVVFKRDEQKYSFDAVVIRAPHREGNVWYIDIRQISEISKVQRREFYRLSDCLSFSYHIITNDSGSHSESGSSKEVELDLLRKIRIADSTKKLTVETRNRELATKFGLGSSSLTFKGSLEDTVFKNVATKDISGNGLSFESVVSIKEGTRLDGTLFIEHHPISFVGEIVRNIKLDKKFLIGVKIIDISKSDSQKLLSYIFRQQNKRAVYSRRNMH